MKILKMKYSASVHADLLNERKRLLTQVEDYETLSRRTMAFHAYLIKALPDNLKDKVEFYFTDCGAKYPMCYMYITGADEEAKTKNTILIVEWAATLDKWKFKKTFNNDDGKFKYALNRYIGQFIGHYHYVGYEIVIFNGENIDGCKITKKRKMRYVYETDCSDA